MAGAQGVAELAGAGFRSRPIQAVGCGVGDGGEERVEVALEGGAGLVLGRRAPGVDERAGGRLGDRRAEPDTEDDDDDGSDARTAKLVALMHD